MEPSGEYGHKNYIQNLAIYTFLFLHCASILLITVLCGVSLFVFVTVITIEAKINIVCNVS